MTLSIKKKPHPDRISQKSSETHPSRKLIPVLNGKNYLQTHGTAMGTKMAVAFAGQHFYRDGRITNPTP